MKTTNDTKSGRLSARVDTQQTFPARSADVAAKTATEPQLTVLAATAEAAGPTGSYKATSLDPSGTWSAGGSTGAFTWSYPIDVPEVPGGPTPPITLAYSSQAVDGRTAASNNQPSWIGDGWSWEPGYIERRYKACNDDKDGGTNTAKVGDLCWYNDNAVLSLGGTTTELVWDEGKGWHPATDSGEKVEKLTGAVNGDQGTGGVDGVGEHWKVTTRDGTQYFFGLNRLPGWSDHGSAADDPVTNSTLTLPVFGNQTGEPCYNASFADAWCQQAWRWQLDYVVDVHGNAMALYWNKESNNYGRNWSETTGKSTVTPYTRAAYLDHIDYGLRSDAVYTGKAMAQVVFGVSERCLTSCGTFDETNAKNWPDVPFDLYCKSDATECKNQNTPSFWTRKRLTSVTTKVLTGGTYQDVDTWELKQGFPASGDGISTPMWLESITRTGKAGGTAGLPAVTFTGQQMANRVDALGDGLAPFVRLRISQITTETGGTIAVNYSKPGCTATSLPAADGTNTTRCYPFKWAFEGETAKQDWFNSYVVQQVLEGDNLASTPDTVTSYSHLGGAAWAKSTDEFTKAEDRSYSVARGYGRVQTRTGAGFDALTLTEDRYFRGLDGKEVADSSGATVTDREQFAGQPREHVTYNGDDTSQFVSAISYTPWRSAPTATRTRAGLPDLNAYMVDVQKEQTRTAISGGKIRTTELTRSFDSYGLISSVSETGDTEKTGDETCTTTTYARNTSRHLLTPVARQEKVAVLCGASVTRPDDVIDDVRTYYDNGALGAAPTVGDVTKIEQINGTGDGYNVTSTVPSICGTDKTQLCYDQYGRPLAASDAYGKTTTTTYLPTQGEVPTQETVTNPLQHTVVTKLDPLRGQPLQVTDANSKVTTTAYDPLGRVTKVWLPSRSAITYPDSPNYAFAYLVRRDGPIVTTTKTLTHDSQYNVSYAIADGLLRPRQTQATSPDGTGRLVTETFYDTRGLDWRTSGTYYATGTAEPVLVTGQELNYPASADTEYDGAGRITAVISRKFGDETKRSTTLYGGDTTTVIPPKGGTATTTVVDALGRTVEVKQYTNDARTTSQSTTYRYNKRGLLDLVTDPSGAKWTYVYDVRGRNTQVTDPDKGTATTVYDKGDRITDVTDVGRKITLHTDYDQLSRKTALKKDTKTLAAWTYDTAASGKGQLAKSIRYVDDKAYEYEITSYNSLYQPVGTQLTVPATEGPLAGTYQWTTVYNANTGQVKYTDQRAMGGLPEETIAYTYTPVHGLLATAGTTDIQLVSANNYDHYGRNIRQEYGQFGKHLWRTSEYDEHTGDLTRAYTDRDVAPQRIDDTKYTYNPIGAITSIATAYGQDTARTTDTQCFALDALNRITEAWTNTGTQCASAPSDATVGGPDAYWTSYTYDAIGNRKTETQHKTVSGPAADTIRAYTAPQTGTHNLPGVSQTGTNAHTETYTYDPAGNLDTRTIGTNAAEKFLWDDEGHLKTVAQGTKNSQYLYDADGQRLIRRDSTGTTLYLPNGNELHRDESGTVTGTRYYTAGNALAVRRGGKVSFLLGDHHGTATTEVTADATQKVTLRKTGIFGASRGTQPANWTGDKGFVGGTKDTETGLVHLGAREYDPTIGRFISVDPVMDLNDPQQVHGYSYSNNNPVSLTDPSGTRPDGLCGGNTSRCAPDYSKSRVPVDNHESWQRTRSGWMWHSYSGKPKYAITGCVGCNATYITLHKKPLAWTDVAESVAFVQPELSPIINAGLGINAAFNGNYGEATSRALDMIPGRSLARYAGLIGKEKKVRKRLSCATEGGGNSFSPNTPVLLRDGKTKKIADLKPGDKVEAADPKTGKYKGSRGVTAKHVHHDTDLVDLTIQDTRGNKTTLHTTAHHPFWNDTQKKWVDATDLKADDNLNTADNQHVKVVTVRTARGAADMYNLTVTDLHTYYVLAGEVSVLVHNCGGGALDLDNLQDRADTLHALIPAGKANDRATTGVMHAVGGGPESLDVVAVGARKNISQIQRAQLLPHELGISRTGVDASGNFPHAEVKLWETAVHLDLTPTGLAVNRPFCPACRGFLQGKGATLVSDTQAIWTP
ncbi:polymorphic toxin-type HINT domain-containing protein [Streptomyces sp. NPDC057611]|uniref:polymorphic toxin-type HINT domain-containing protein n=1 Tax=Streptomyces sp. NPDC057611 TaxID=3346182 RepID=UPI0036C7D51E